MNGHSLFLNGARLAALGSGALFWADEGVLVVSDLHFGKFRRFARRGGAMLPPYEVRETLIRLETAIAATGADTVVCLGDSFDDISAAGDLGPAEVAMLAQLMQGRRWIWVEGNHDPGPQGLGGTHAAEYMRGPLIFRHVAVAGARGEVSGHFHPKARIALGGGGLSRPCFLADAHRIVMPAFGTYTGGLDCRRPPLSSLMSPGAMAVLTGPSPLVIPMPSAR